MKRIRKTKTVPKTALNRQMFSLKEVNLIYRTDNQVTMLSLVLLKESDYLNFFRQGFYR
jgi:hypothetical protein